MQSKPVVPAANGLIQIESGEAWTTSLAIAEAFGRAHRSVLESLDTLIADGTLDRKHEIMPTMRDIPGPKGAVRQERYFRLNERAALIAMPFIGGRQSRVGQKRLVDAFMEMRSILRQHDAYGRSADWIEARAKGKEIRHDNTDVIKDFIAYAFSQGSRSAQKYYMQLTKMSYREIFVIGKEAVEKNFRDGLSTAQLVQLATAETIIIKALLEGMAKEIPYKDIYRLARDRVASLCELIGKTPPAKLLSASNMPNFRLPA